MRHSGFTKAFHAAFGCSPALLRAYMGIYLIKTDIHAKPEAILKEKAVTPDMADILKEYRDFRAGKSIDERAVLVALADRLHNMRTVEFMDLKVQREKAEETMEVFAPLAARCGNIKCRLEFDEISEKYRRPPAGMIE